MIGRVLLDFVPGLLPATLTALPAGAGVAIECWMLFSEAKPTVTLYYGAATV